MIKKVFGIFSVFLVICVIFTARPASAATFDIDFATSCQALELVNLDTGTVVYAKNADEQREPASLTKIMTFIVVSEHISDLQGTNIPVNQSVVDQLSGTGSSMAGIKAGDVLTAYQLLNCMMVPSGNDAALVLADYVGGGNVQAFVDMMNEKAAALGCTGTHFANPHGLHDPNHYTTASDFAKIAQYAMTLPYFMDICNQTTYSYSPVGGPDAGITMPALYTTNLLLEKNVQGGKYFYKYAKGVKTGHTSDSGYCLVSTATADGYSYLCVAMGAPITNADGSAVPTRGEMVDSVNLYKWAFRSLQIKQIVAQDDTLGEVKLNYAWGQDTLLLTAQNSYSTILPSAVQASSVLITKNIPASVDAPVKKGDVVGTATLSYAGQDLATINLVASESVEESQLLRTMEVVKGIFTSVWFIVIASVIVLLILLYIVLAVIYNRKKKQLRKVKKYRKM